VAHDENLNVLLSIATIYNLKIKHMDEENAFLNATLQEDIWVRQPEGFVDN